MYKPKRQKVSFITTHSLTWEDSSVTRRAVFLLYLYKYASVAYTLDKVLQCYKMYGIIQMTELFQKL